MATTASTATQLEVIDKGVCTPVHPVPLVFVHGAWHGAWCWDEYFLDYFAGQGYRALAVSLRGHGKSPTPKPLRDCSCADYVNDVRSVAGRLPTAPVVIGHSLVAMWCRSIWSRSPRPQEYCWRRCRCGTYTV